MFSIPSLERHRDRVTSHLAGTYANVFGWYVVGVAVLWCVGIEAIYDSPTPFYAMVKPIFTNLSAPLMVLAVMLAGAIALRRRYFDGSQKSDKHLVVLCATLFIVALAGMPFAGLGDCWRQTWRHVFPIGIWFFFCGIMLRTIAQVKDWDTEPVPRTLRWILAGMILFLFLYAAAIAGLREGLEGIAQAFMRQKYEPIGDIGLGGSLRGLFHDFVKLQPHLSLHARMHPPGAIGIVWILSWVVGNSPLGISLGVMAIGALTLIPLFLWFRDLTNTRTALIGCLLFTAVPSITIFTATSMDITFLFFGVWSLFLFDRAIKTRSMKWAIAAGLGYGVLSMVHFSLLTLGAYFGFVGLYRIWVAPKRLSETLFIARTAVLMLAGAIGFDYLIYLWSGCNIVNVLAVEFEGAAILIIQKMGWMDASFVHSLYPQWTQSLPVDVVGEAEADMAPRFTMFAWRFITPFCLMYYVGIPISVLCWWRLRHPRPETKHRYILFLLTLFVLNLLYLAKGEGERSAMYFLPFLILPAADLMTHITEETKSIAPLTATFAFLAWQAWFTECILYTYW